MHKTLKNITDKKNKNFFLLAGPCAIEGEEIAFEIARKIKIITNKLDIPFIFKGSYRKANRSRLDSFTGIGDEKALAILKKIGEELNVPTVTDIHEVSDAEKAAGLEKQRQGMAAMSSMYSEAEGQDVLTKREVRGIIKQVVQKGYGGSAGFGKGKFAAPDPKFKSANAKPDPAIQKAADMLKKAGYTVTKT